jgi:hypothetical protein
MSRRSAIVAIFALACGACSAPTVPFSVLVDPPGADDAGNANPSCVGVVGFTVNITSGTSDEPTATLLATGPILDPRDCKLPQPFAVDRIALDAMLTVRVEGFDSAGIRRVSGSGTIGNLNGGALRVQLRDVTGGMKPDILVIDRRPLLGGAKETDVMTMAVSTQMANKLVFSASRQPFFTVEPGAFGIDPLTELQLRVVFTMVPGVTAPSPARLTAKMMGRYWIAN